MFRKPMLAIAAAIVVAASPAGAQEEASENPLAELAAAFEAEPLTSEQQARLPLARAIVEKVVPPGTLGGVMGSVFEGFLDPITKLAREPSASDVAGLLGVTEDEIALDEEQTAEAIAILDPAMREREERTVAAMPQAMAKMADAMEPEMRRVMAEIYAVYFDTRELTDIDAFFSTPSGAAYARKSYQMATDPRFIGGMMSSMPAILQSAEDMEATLKAVTADLPGPRKFDDLSSTEVARLAKLIGLAPDEIEASMRAAVAASEAVEETGEEK